MAIPDRVNDIQSRVQAINDQLAALQNTAQPLQAEKTALQSELSDRAVVKNYPAFLTWKAAQP